MSCKVPQTILNALCAGPSTRKHRQIAVKVIDDRGNELLVVRKLDEAEPEK